MKFNNSMFLANNSCIHVSELAKVLLNMRHSVATIFVEVNSQRTYSEVYLMDITSPPPLIDKHALI